MSSLWITNQVYKQNTIEEKYKKVVEQIENEYSDKVVEAQKHCTYSGLLLVHPSKETQEIRSVAESSRNFRQLCTLLSFGLDISKMYEAGFRHDIGMVNSDVKNLSRAMQRKFEATGLLQKINHIIYDMVESGEMFSWIPVLEDKSDNLPVIPNHYVIVLFENEWIVRDLNNKKLKLLFLNSLKSDQVPKSTVSYMMQPFQDMQSLRDQFVTSTFFATRPSYLASFHRDKNKQSLSENKLLDNTLVNQAKVNEELEHMVMEKVKMSSKYTNNIQKRTTLHGNLNDFVSELSSAHLNEIKEKQAMKMSLENMKQKLKDQECVDDSPLKWTVPSDFDVSNANLGVQLIDMLSFERRHEKEWLATCVGYGKDTTSAIHNGSSEMENHYLRKKHILYSNMLIHNVLQNWTHKSGITLCVPCDVDTDLSLPK